MYKDMQAPPAPGFMPPPGYTAQPPPSYFPEQSMPPPQQPSVIVVGSPAFGSEPQRLTCPHCHNVITTSVETEANSRTHMFALLFCLFGLFCLAPCPYCIDSCMSSKHYCPSCRAYLGECRN